MTVVELIEKLKEMDPDAFVFVDVNGDIRPVWIDSQTPVRAHDDGYCERHPEGQPAVIL